MGWKVALHRRAYGVQEDVGGFRRAWEDVGGFRRV